MIKCKIKNSTDIIKLKMHKNIKYIKKILILIKDDTFI